MRDLAIARTGLIYRAADERGGKRGLRPAWRPGIQQALVENALHATERAGRVQPQSDVPQHAHHAHRHRIRLSELVEHTVGVGIAVSAATVAVLRDWQAMWLAAAALATVAGLALAAIPADTLTLRLHFDPSRIDRTTAARMLDQLAALLGLDQDDPFETDRLGDPRSGRGR